MRFASLEAFMPPIVGCLSLGLMLAVLGVVLYVPQKKDPAVQAIDLISSLGKTFEEIVVYGSVPLAGVTMIIHLPDYDA